MEKAIRHSETLETENYQWTEEKVRRVMSNFNVSPSICDLNQFTDKEYVLSNIWNDNLWDKLDTGV